MTKEIETNPHLGYVALENFWLSSQDKLNKLFGERVASMLWVSKDMAARDSSMKKTFATIEQWIKTSIEEGKSLRVRFDVSEKSALLSPIDTLERGAAIGEEKVKEYLTGHDNLDYTIERIIRNGCQMEELHSATYFKQQIDSLFKPEGFTDEGYLHIEARMPIADQISEMDNELMKSIKGGLRHPYLTTLAIGQVVLEIKEEDGSVTEIPLLRRQVASDFSAIADRVMDEVSSICKELSDANKELQETLTHLPENWPDPESYAKAQKVAAMRFMGDNGLGHSDFYEGAWPSMAQKLEVHAVSESVVEVNPEDVLFPAFLDISKRKVEKNESTPAWLTPGKNLRV